MIRSICLALPVILVLFLPLRIEAQDFSVKALHVDLRTQVMTTDALESVARQAAEKGLNTLIMEWEATFPFQENSTLCNSEAYTREELSAFIAYAESLGLDVIPLQNCFGHCEYILRHDRYASLREDEKEYSQVCPLKLEKDKVVFRSIFKEVAALHPSPYFHIGADETRLLGNCRRCADFVKQKGVSRLYADYVTEMCGLVRELGKTPVIWGDMILRHPECIDLLPEDVVVIDWNYGWEPSRFGDIRKLIGSGVTLWGATALRSAPDDIFQTSWSRHFNNLSDYIPFARVNGFSGMVQTSWSTSGEYGYTWDANGLIGMQPVRQVFPLDGFNILIAAFGQAVRQGETLDTERFIVGYCRDRFGLDEASASLMKEIFSLEQQPVTLGQKKSAALIDGELDNCRKVLCRLRNIRPLRNKEEFLHFCMMWEIREHYLEFRKLEEWEESDRCAGRADRKPFLKALHRLQRKGVSLQKKFCRMHSGYLKSPSVAFGKESYLDRLDELTEKYERL